MPQGHYPQPPRKSGRNYDTNFRESLSASIPNRTYRTRIDVPTGPSLLELVIRFGAAVMVTCLILRFAIEAITARTGDGLVRAIDLVTSWLVAPIQGALGAHAQTAAGYIDWAVLIAIIVVIGLASVLSKLTRKRLSY